MRGGWLSRIDIDSTLFRQGFDGENKVSQVLVENLKSDGLFFNVGWAWFLQCCH